MRTTYYPFIDESTPEGRKTLADSAQDQIDFGVGISSSIGIGTVNNPHAQFAIHFDGSEDNRTGGFEVNGNSNSPGDKHGARILAYNRVKANRGFRRLRFQASEYSIETPDAGISSTNSGPTLNITGFGSVGIGTTDPLAQLDIRGDARFNNKIYDKDGDSGTSGQVLSSTGTQVDWVNVGTLSAGTASQVAVTASNDNSNFNITFVDSTSGNLSIKADTTGDFVYNPSLGNVGIGTTIPGTNIHISGTGQNGIRIDTDATGLSFHNYSEFMGFMGNDSGKLFINAGGTQDTLSLRTGGNERLRITSTGAVQITGADDQDNLVVNGGSTQFAVHQDDTDGEVSLRAQDGSGNNFTKYMTFFTENGSGPEERLRITEPGNVGIGTTTPSVKLDVIGDATVEGDLFLKEVPSDGICKINANGNLNLFADGQIKFYESDANKLMVTFDINTTHNDSRMFMESDDDTYLNHPGQNQFGFTIGGSDTLRLIQNAVGLGTTNPQKRLHVVNTSANAVPLLLERTHNNNVVVEYKNSTDSMFAGLAGDALGWGVGTAADLGSQSNNKLMVKPNGKIGIGIIDPTAKLDVSGDIRAFTDSDNLILLNSSDGSIELKRTGGPFIDFADSGGDDHDCRIKQEDNGLAFTTGGQGSADEKLRINSSGNVGIGSTIPQVKLDVKGDVHTDDITMTSTGAGGPSLTLFHDSASPASGDQVGYINFSGKNNTGGVIQAAELRAVMDNVLNASESGHLRFSTTHNSLNSEKLRITSDGNVGIGTDNPTYLLHTFNGVAVGSTENNRKYNGRFTTYTPNRLNLDIYDRRWQDGETHGWHGTEKRIEYNIDNNANKRMWMSFFNPSSTTNDNIIRFGEQEDTEWMRIDNGNVGIGTDNPTAGLDVNISGTTTGDVIFCATAAGSDKFRILGNGVVNSYSNFVIGDRGGNASNTLGDVNFQIYDSNPQFSLTHYDTGNSSIDGNHTIIGASDGLAFDSTIGTNSLGSYVFRGKTTGPNPVYLKLSPDGAVISGITTLGNAAIEGNVHQSTNDGLGTKTFVLNRSYTMSTSSTDVLTLGNWGNSAFDITVFRRDSTSPAGAQVMKLYLAFAGSGTNMTSATIVQETKVTRGSIHTTTYSISEDNNDATLSVTGNDNGGESQILTFYIIAHGSPQGFVNVI